MGKKAFLQKQEMIMKDNSVSRRQFIAAAGAAFGAAMTNRSKAGTGLKTPFRYCLNTSTIRGQKLSLKKEIEITAQAGYNAIEPWVDKIHSHARNGGDLKDIRRQLNDSGLTVESAISFFRWIVDNDAERTKGLEQARRDMDVLAQIGGKRIAAPPAGATRQAGLDLKKAAERYHALLELGEQMLQ